MNESTLAIVFGSIGFGFGLCGLIAIIQFALLKRDFDLLKEEVNKLKNNY